MFRFYRLFVKWFLDLLYTRLARFYNIVAKLVSKGDWYNWVYQIENFLLPNDKILEVGIGTGELYNHLSKKQFLVFGIDLSKQMIKISTASHNKPEIKVIRGNNVSLPFSNNCFDKVLATFPSDYVYNPQFVHEVLNVLNKNGELIILLCVNFTNKGILNRIYQFIYEISGQPNSKYKIESFLFEYFSSYASFGVEWVPYKNVELCFIKIKKC